MSTIANAADGLRVLVRLAVPPPLDPPRFANDTSCGWGGGADGSRETSQHAIENTRLRSPSEEQMNADPAKWMWTITRPT